MKRRGILRESLLIGLILFMMVSMCYPADVKTVNLTEQVKDLLTTFKTVLSTNKVVVKNWIANDKILLKNDKILVNLLSNAIACAPEGSTIVLKFDYKNSLIVETLDKSTRFDVVKEINLDGYTVNFKSYEGIGSKFEVNLTPVVCKL